MSEMLSSGDDDDDEVVTEISSDDGKDWKDNDDEETDANINKSTKSGKKLLKKRQSELPQTIKKSSKGSSRPPSGISEYSFTFESDDEAPRKADEAKASAVAKRLVKKKIISPYGEQIMTAFINAASRKTTKPSTSGPNLSFDKDKSMTFSIAAAKLRWQKERLNDATTMHKKVLELTDENRTLNRVVKRQSLALNRLSGAEGDLPVLLRAHNEETRVLKLKLKQAADLNRAQEQKYLDKCKELHHLKDSHKKLEALSQNRNLKEREALQTELEDTKQHLYSRDEQVKDLYHRILVMEKSSRQQLRLERHKVNAFKKRLDDSDQEIRRLQNIIKEKDKIIDRSNIYSRCHISPAKTKQTSLSTANSMISLRPPLSGATLDSKSRSKSYHGNLNSTTDNNAKDDEKSWGRTTTIYEKISGKKVGYKDSDSELCSSSDDEKEDTLNGIDDMSEVTERKNEARVDHSKFCSTREVNQDKSEEGTIITEIKRKSRKSVTSSGQKQPAIVSDVGPSGNGTKDEKAEPSEKLLLELSNQLAQRNIFGEEKSTSVIASDEEDEGIGNGETQSEKEGDTPADLKEDPHVLDDEQLVEIPNENATMESEKLKIWFGKEKNHDSPAGTGQIVGTPSLTLEDDTKAALLAKLRELDDGWEDNQKEDSYVPSFAKGERRSGRQNSTTRFLLKGYQTADTPFASAFHRDGSPRSTSPASSIKSVTSLDPMKKTRIMNELFGQTLKADSTFLG